MDVDLKSRSCSEWKAFINEWCYSARNREILVDRLLNGYTYEVIAELHKMSVSQVKRIVKKELDNLINHL